MTNTQNRDALVAGVWRRFYGTISRDPALMAVVEGYTMNADAVVRYARLVSARKAAIAAI